MSLLLLMVEFSQTRVRKVLPIYSQIVFFFFVLFCFVLFVLFLFCFVFCFWGFLNDFPPLISIEDLPGGVQ